MIRLEADGAPTLALYHRPAAADLGDVIYVHGSTFGAGLSVLYPLDGRSWADALCEAGFNVWAFDFVGYGASDRYPQDAAYPVGDLAQVLPQLQRVVAAVRVRNHGRRVSLLAHSWGGTVALRYAAEHAEQLASLLLFAPILSRAASATPPPAPASSHLLLSAWAQYRRFTEDVPAGAAQPLAEAHFQAWSTAFLATDPEAGARTPPAVLSPAGPKATCAHCAAVSRCTMPPPSPRRPCCCAVSGIAPAMRRTWRVCRPRWPTPRKSPFPAQRI